MAPSDNPGKAQDTERRKGKLQGQIAIVTGGGRGIGKSIALAYATEGAYVVICGRDQQTLADAARQGMASGGFVVPVVADVSSESDVERLVQRTVTEFGKVDLLVNNAGIGGQVGPITDVSTAVWNETIAINLTGVFLCSRAVVRDMMKRGRGNIINISSTAGRVGSRVRSVTYTASKFGVEGITYALATQLKQHGICVNALRPGLIATDMQKNSPSEFVRPLRPPEDVNKLAIFLALQTVETMTGESIELSEWERTQGAPGRQA